MSITELFNEVAYVNLFICVCCQLVALENDILLFLNAKCNYQHLYKVSITQLFNKNAC